MRRPVFLIKGKKKTAHTHHIIHASLAFKDKQIVKHQTLVESPNT